MSYKYTIIYAMPNGSGSAYVNTRQELEKKIAELQAEFPSLYYIYHSLFDSGSGQQGIVSDSMRLIVASEANKKWPNTTAAAAAIPDSTSNWLMIAGAVGLGYLLFIK